MIVVSAQETAQARKVRDAYSRTGDLNPEYLNEFDVLSDMRMNGMAREFRNQRGLPRDAKTPYDR